MDKALTASFQVMRGKNVQSAASKDGITRCHHNGSANSHPNPLHWPYGLPRGVGTPHPPSYAGLPSEQVQRGWDQAEDEDDVLSGEGMVHDIVRELRAVFSGSFCSSAKVVSMRSKEGAITSCKGYLNSSSADVEL